MRILYFIEGTGGGAITHVLNLGMRLPKNKVEPSIVFFLDGPSVKDAEYLGLNYKLIPWKFSLDPSLIWRLIKTIQKEKVDIIHSHTITGNFYARLAVLLSSRSLISVTTVHSFIIDELRGSTKVTIKDRLRYIRELCTWKIVDHFIAVSEEIKKSMVEKGIQERKITVINNGVVLPDVTASFIGNETIRKKFTIKNDETVITIIGRLVPLKEHSLFLGAAKSVRKKLPNVKFLIVGDGPLLHALKGEARKLGVREDIIFTGWRHDVQNILFGTDIYVICSTIEGLNISVLEAMACGKPVVGTTVKGITESVVDKETGILVPPNDADALAKAILYLSKNKELSRRMGLNGRNAIEQKYSIQKMVDKTIEVYERLFSQSGRSFD